DYTENQPVAGNYFTTQYNSDTRNSYSHFVYVGAEHVFTPELSGAAQAGVQYSDYYNDPNGTTTLGPYGQLSVTYAYRPDGKLKVGFTEQQTATDLVGGNAGLITGAQTSVAFASIKQQLLTKFFGSVIGTYQNTIYNGDNSPYNNQADNYYSVGVDLEYRLNPNFSAHTGYNFDRLGSDIPYRSFSRNRVYVGVTASY
ncbi:MAG TPA: outer membrane beta-barrel protein, partial [Verrucomicrobiae bacterium]|nr:outer membrane beta-barrel protein [Verrucomicrobiae bacterium]